MPDETVRAARVAFRHGNPYVLLRDRLGTVFADTDFTDFYPKLGQPAYAPWRLALVTLMQFREGLSDRQAAEAVRGRIDWKYLLALDLADAGFDFSVPCEFRGRLLEHRATERLLACVLGSRHTTGSWPVLVIMLPSPHGVGEPDLLLVAGPGCGPAPNLGIEPAPPTITLTLTSRSRPAPCPLCSRRAMRTHSWYERALADLPWGEHAVAVRLRVRKLFCNNARCKRRIFTERLPGVATPWARKTARLSSRLTAIGLALGGAAGARLGRSMGLAMSRNTLLRLVRQAPLPQDVTPAALGVDDWALRKRHTYGTVLVDLDRHRPLALLPDREAETLAGWLREHSGVEVLSRDRARAYAAGGRSGAPDAVQVADRFHLLQNLAEVLELVFTGHPRKLRDAEQARRQNAAADGSPVRPDPPPPPKRPLAMAAARREQRMITHQRVWDLYRQGWPGEKIASHLGIGRTTTYRHLKSEVFPERKGRRDAGRSSMDPWRDWIIEHWNRGQRNGRQTLRDLQAKGFTGNYATVLRYLNRLRDAQRGAAPCRPRMQPGLPLVAAPKLVLTPRTAAWTVLRRLDRRSDEEAALLGSVRA